MCCYGQHTVFNREAAHEPSIQTYTHVIKYDLFFSQSKGIICAEARVYSVYKCKPCTLFYITVECFFFFFKSDQMKNSKNICLVALQSSSEWRSLLKRNVPAPPDWLYIVIHCTPAAGSHSPPSLCHGCSHSWTIESPQLHHWAQTPHNSVSQSVTPFTRMQQP